MKKTLMMTSFLSLATFNVFANEIICDNEYDHYEEERLKLNIESSKYIYLAKVISGENNNVFDRFKDRREQAKDLNSIYEQFDIAVIRPVKLIKGRHFDIDSYSKKLTISKEYERRIGTAKTRPVSITKQDQFIIFEDPDSEELFFTIRLCKTLSSDYYSDLYLNKIVEIMDKNHIEHHPISKFDEYGFDYFGFDKDGFNKYGFNIYGFDVNGFDEDGFDINGLDKNGKTKKELN